MSSSLMSKLGKLNRLSRREQRLLLKKLFRFFGIFPVRSRPYVIRRTIRFLASLSMKNSLSFSCLDALLDLLDLVERGTGSEEERKEGARLLDKALMAGGDKKPSSLQYMRLCIKQLYPLLYDLGTQRPTEDRLYFMQPRSGLNESFRFFYHKLEKEYPAYELKLYEFDRERVSLAEYYVNAAFFMRDMAQAKAVFVHESNNLMGYLNIRPETKVVQLWHGCGVFKHLGLSTAGKAGFKSLEHYREFPEYNKYSLVTIASPEIIWVFEEFMGIPRESGIIQPYGVCRTDEVFLPDYRRECFEKLYEAIPAARGKKVILYAPTYRGLDPNRYSPDELDVEAFACALGEDHILIMKHHQTVKTLPEIPVSCRDTFAYDMTRGRGMNINELMTVADICITDYSSVAFEFSLFERPLLFFVYDMDEYIDNRGLYYNFDEITPGPLCRTNEEMISCIEKLRNGFDATEIRAFREKFMSSCDGHASERVIRYLGLKSHP